MKNFILGGVFSLVVIYLFADQIKAGLDWVGDFLDKTYNTPEQED